MIHLMGNLYGFGLQYFLLCPFIFDLIFGMQE